MTSLELFLLNHQALAYLVVFGAMFVEGEAIFILSAILAAHGVLSWTFLLPTIFTGVMLGDIAWYGVGKYLQNTRLGFFMKIKFSRYHEWLDKNFLQRYARMVFYSKFLHYVNRLTPLIAGWNHFPFRRFLRLHLYAAVLWIVVMTAGSLGIIYIGGESVTRWLVDNLLYTFLGLILLFFIIEFFLKRAFSKRIEKTL